MLMPLATWNILSDAHSHGYAVPALSVQNVTMVDAVLAEAEAQKYPIILQIGQRAIRNGLMKTLADHIRRMCESVSVPVVIHLDHSQDYEQVVWALRFGFTSCMFDGSLFPMDKNIAMTKEVVRLCHAVDIPVEGELGTIGGVEDDIDVANEDAQFTSPEDAARFVHETGVDSLAVAVGSAHGMYKETPSLDLDRLRDISNVTRIPLVLHGGSGIPKEQIRNAVRLGVSKINFDTELRLAYVSGLKMGVVDYPDDPYSAEQVAVESLRAIVRQKIEWCKG